MERQILQHLRTDVKDKKPSPDNIMDGELVINYAAGGETLMIKNSENEIIEFGDKKFVEDNYYNKSTIDKKITDKQDAITDLETIRQGAAKGATALQSYTEQYKGTVTGVKINGTTKNPSSGIVDLGTVITAHQTLKTINGESIVGSGDITISGGGSSDANIQAVDTGDVLDDVTVNYATKAYVDGKVANIDLTNYATIAYVDGLVGDINSVLESIISGVGGSVMPIVLNAANGNMGNRTTPPSDNPNAKKLYEELMLLSNNTGEGTLDVGLVTLYLTHPGITGGSEYYCDVTSYSLAPSYIAEGILLYMEGFSYYVLQQDGTIQSVFYD